MASPSPYMRANKNWQLLITKQPQIKLKKKGPRLQHIAWTTKKMVNDSCQGVRMVKGKAQKTHV